MALMCISKVLEKNLSQHQQQNDAECNIQNSGDDE